MDLEQRMRKDRSLNRLDPVSLLSAGYNRDK